MNRENTSATQEPPRTLPEWAAERLARISAARGEAGVREIVRFLIDLGSDDHAALQEA